VTRLALLPRWEQLEETIPARTTLPALGRITCVPRPGSVSGADLALRSFAAFLAEEEDVDEARWQLAAVG